MDFTDEQMFVIGLLIVLLIIIVELLFLRYFFKHEKEFYVCRNCGSCRIDFGDDGYICQNCGGKVE